MLSLRQTLAEARIALRQAKDALRNAEIIGTLHITGKNEAERKSSAAQALLNNGIYQEALARVRAYEATLERAEQAIAEQEHELRVREVAAREKLAEVLRGRRVDDAVLDSLSSIEAAQRRGYAPRVHVNADHNGGEFEHPVDTTEWYGR